MHLDKISEAVKAGIRMAGGTPIEFPAIGVCDGIAMNHEGMFLDVYKRQGSRRGSKHDPRFLFAAGRMPSYNKVALSYNKATFLTEYAELGKMRSGAVAKTAVGHSLEKGGDAVGIRTKMCIRDRLYHSAKYTFTGSPL